MTLNSHLSLPTCHFSPSLLTCHLSPPTSQGSVTAVLTPSDVRAHALSFTCKESSSMLDIFFSGLIIIMIMILDLVLVPRIGSNTHILVQVLHLKDKKCYMCVWDLNRVIHSFPYPTLSGQAQLIKVRYDPHGTSTYAPLGSTVRAGGESLGLPDVINVDTCVVRLVPIRRKREEKERRRRESRKRGEKGERR